MECWGGLETELNTCKSSEKDDVKTSVYFTPSSGQSTGNLNYPSRRRRRSRGRIRKANKAIDTRALRAAGSTTPPTATLFARMVHVFAHYTSRISAPVQILALQCIFSGFMYRYFKIISSPPPSLSLSVLAHTGYNKALYSYANTHESWSLGKYSH